MIFYINSKVRSKTNEAHIVFEVSNFDVNNSKKKKS